jgi:hypothetical protein
MHYMFDVNAELQRRLNKARADNIYLTGSELNEKFSEIRREYLGEIRDMERQRVMWILKHEK